MISDMKLTDLVSYDELREGIFEHLSDGPLDIVDDFCLATLIPNSRYIWNDSSVEAFSSSVNIHLDEWVQMGDHLIHLDYEEEGRDYGDLVYRYEEDLDDFLQSLLASITIYHVSDIQVVLASIRNFQCMKCVAQAVDPVNWKTLLHTLIDKSS